MKRSFIYFVFFAVFLQYGLLEDVFSQADAGEDKCYVKGQVGPVIGGAGDPSWCYSWEPKTGLSDPHSPHPTATPDKTTKYKLKVVGPNFSFTSEDEMTVYVVDKLKLEVEKNITQCMEGRDVTFTATIEGDVPASLPDQVEFIFHYKKADGTEWTADEWSFDTKQDNTPISDKVPDGDADHKFTTPIYAEAKFMGCTLKSNTLNIDVYELWIEYVRYNAAKPWKAVVGEPFEYSGIASTDCKDWDWDMEDGFPDTWNPTGGNQKQGNMTIPYSDLSGAKNSYFGDAYGTVNVSCKDEEDNEYTFYSTDMNPSQKVKVFFDPDKNVNGGAPSTSNPPCWFVFWKDGTVIEDMGICSYDQTEQFGAWSPSKGMVLGPDADDSNSGPETLNDMSGNAFTMTGTGKHIKCVAETMSHELYHKYVYDTWKSTTPQTDSDELPDAEENSPHRAYFKKSNPNNHNTFGYTLYATTGYADQEVRCRIIEISPGVKQTYPDKDWSKDTENPKW